MTRAEILAQVKARQSGGGSTKADILKAVRDRQLTSQPQEVNTEGKANQPGYQPPSKLQSALLGAVDTTMFGFPDEIVGGINYAAHLGKEGSYTEGRDAYRQGARVAQEENPKSFLGGQIGGGIASTMMMPTGAALRGAALLPKVGRAAMIGATEGGLYGTGSATGGLADRAQGAAEGAVWGGALGGAGPIIGRTIGKVTGKLSSALDQPLAYAQELKNKIYKRATDAGIALTPQETNAFWGRLSNRLAGEAADATNHGGTISALNTFERSQTAPNLSLAAIEKLRSRLGEISGMGGTDGNMARQVRKEIDKVTTTLKRNQVISTSGESPQAVVRILKDAREANTRFRNTEDIQRAITKAQGSSRAVQSGDLEGALQTEFRKIYNNQRQMGFLSQGERTMVNRIVTQPTSKAKARWLNDITKRFTLGLADTPGEAVGGVIGGTLGSQLALPTVMGIPLGAYGGAAAGVATVKGFKKAIGMGGSKERMAEQLVQSAAQAGAPIKRVTAPAEKKVTNALLSGANVTNPLLPSPNEPPRMALTQLPDGSYGYVPSGYQ